MTGPDSPAPRQNVFVGRRNLLKFTDQLIEPAGGKRIEQEETFPVLVVEGIGGSGRSALLQRICEQWAGRSPLVFVSPLDLPGNDDTIRPVLAAVMLGLSATVPGYKVTFPRVLLAEIAMKNPGVPGDADLAVKEMTKRLETYRDPRMLVTFVGNLVRAAGRLGHGNVPVVDAIAPTLADNLADKVVTRLRGSRWLAKLSWQEELDWFGQHSHMGNNDPIRALVQLNRWATNPAADARDQLDDQLVDALLADLRHSLARTRGRPGNAVVLLDNGDAPSVSAFVSSLLRVRRIERTPDPLTLITVSGGMLERNLATGPLNALREQESRFPELARSRFRQPELLRLSSADLAEDDVFWLVRRSGWFDWPNGLDYQRIGRAVYRLTGGHPAATMSLLRTLAGEPALINDLDAALRAPDPDSPERLPIEEFLRKRIVRALSPHRQDNDTLLEVLVTSAAGRDRLEAQRLYSLASDAVEERSQLLVSPTLWSHPGPDGEPSLHPFVRYLCLRALAGRSSDDHASWHKAFTTLRAEVSPDDRAGRLHHDLALAETPEQTAAVANELAELLPTMPAEGWLALLDSVVATPDPRRSGRATALVGEHDPHQGTVARLIEVLHALSDRCLSDRRTLGGLCLLAAHDLERLADSSRNAVVLIRRANDYRRLAAPLL